MLLIHLLKILFCLLIIRHCIRWVSYHIRHHNKKERVFHGNTRMPKELEFALMYGFLKRRKKRVKDLSYRKSLAEWRELLNTIYPPDDLSLVTPKSPKGDFGEECFTRKNREQFPFSKLKNKKPDLINNTLTSQIHTDLKSPSGDLGVVTGNQKPYPQLKTQTNSFKQIKKIDTLFTAKPCGKNNGLVSSLLVNIKIVSINNLKISQNTIPFTKQILACHRQFLRFRFVLFSFLFHTNNKLNLTFQLSNLKTF